jgi:hypothetical protein
MNTQILSFAIALCLPLAPDRLFAQSEPLETDTVEYKESYELILDSDARAKKAEALLLRDGKRTANALSPRELSMLCRVYNEMFDTEKQMATSKILWEKSPNHPDATRWMANSYINSYSPTKSNSAEIIKFVDDALSNGRGNRRQLLILKSRALLRQEENLSDAEKRVTVSDLLIQAFVEQNGPDPFNDFDNSPELLLDHDNEFTAYFSAPERETLKVRMKKAAEKE